jgi:type II restriction enzyme
MQDDEHWTNLGFEEAQAVFESPSQNARVLTEGWAGRSLFCPNCGAPSLGKVANNSPVADFRCVECREEYELKSQKGRFGRKVTDGAYGAMLNRLVASNNPNLILMNYDLGRLSVTNLFVVPKQFFIPEIIEPRKPLAPTARRAGWVGCNILIDQVPASGKVFLVRNGALVPKETVLGDWRKTLFLRDQRVEARGWLIEVMKCVELIGRPDFDLDDVYAFEDRLSRLYPDNQHVRPKIRQQLQVLRDHGFLEFLDRGRYRLIAPSA